MGFLPSFLTTWTEAWVQAPYWFATLLAGLIGFYVWNSYVKGNIRKSPRVAGGTSRVTVPLCLIAKVAPGRLWPAWYRGTSLNKWLKVAFKRVLLPIGFSALCVAIGLGAIYRMAIHYPAVSNGACALLQETSRAPYDPDTHVQGPAETRQSHVFHTIDPCFETDFVLEKGQKYKLDVHIIKDSWLDLTIPANHGGFEIGFANVSPLFLSGVSDQTASHAAMVQPRG